MGSSREKISLNVGGDRYEISPSTLQAFPGTKLCHLTEPQACTVFDYDCNHKEFFFDRSPRLFGEVLNYYRTKHLHCPEGICKSAFEEELAFWEISHVPVAPCCWQKVANAEARQAEGILCDETSESDRRGPPLSGERRSNSWRAKQQPKIWALFENPFSSLRAKCLAVVSLLFNIGIVIIFEEKSRAQLHYRYSTTISILENHTQHEHYSFVYQPANNYLYLELFCILWFTFEFSVRLTFCPDTKMFFRNPLNVTDFLSLFPVYIEIFLTGHINNMLSLLSWLGLFRVLYVVKLLKIFKLLETPLMLRVLPFTFRSILKEVFILMMIFTFEILFFGALCYHVELHEPETYFDGMISSFYWAAITLTTVGYGDIVAFSPFGRVIAFCAAICGMLTIIIPLLIFLIKFQGHYAMAVMKEKMKSNKRSH
ncbi:potassium voltage-gated channel subfamily C member 1-like [Eublepharis macularius]|uniref:Potassium voltage-gated channel subfamily C member 1-like n=1 Tax=Eublepharis macularius TaxID=481883 RepID=A0AA97KB50_EUBMA|nr:potassium voltage-gated channel subfamily C member 1-like [Eublepharis macularius]XP_054852337.1 potassium voltage-gated channel subfamily C member 1-like [Eublepharis macularius]